ncbi:MAG TPA: N-methyl-L-tryptophan oxidase [Planctomycetaceae bacterium]|jgi:sarcosine oxidase|nr:N-methyl-L-tryptophan oxidase [Planctomycetaceae bacterium]
MTARFDCIVLGLGGFGSASLYHAAARGLSVLGLEQYSIGHDRGSSHGETRIIRKAYFEHPDYVPLLLRAYELWRDLQATEGFSLMHLCGLLLAGPADGETIAGARLSARLHDLALDDVSPADRAAKFAGFRFPDNFDVVHEPEAGFLAVERCVNAHVDAAIRTGANVATDEAVLDWARVGSTFRVRTSRDEYESAALVLTAGAWTSSLLSNLALPLRVVRKPQFWFPVRSAAYGEDRSTPAFYYEMPYGLFYGFPSRDGQTLKAAEHSGGDPVTDPALVDRTVHTGDIDSLARFLRECLPEVDPEPARSSVCMYTLSPDQHFIVDRHPEYEHVAFGAGFSGHGFKFTPVIGEVLVDLAIDGHTRHPIDFLSASRDAITRATGTGATRKAAGNDG